MEDGPDIERKFFTEKVSSESAWRFAVTVRQHSAKESNCDRGKRYQPTNQPITFTAEICIQQLGRVEEMVWLPYDAGLSAAAEALVGILKTVIVASAIYPHIFVFLHVDIQSTGHTFSRPWSRQQNDVMSEIECAQLHNELLWSRHNILQSHSLFALAKHLSGLLCSTVFVLVNSLRQL